MTTKAEAAYELFKAAIGQDEGTGEWLQVDQDRINSFADVTEDHQFIHVDPEACKELSPWGVPIAHGFLTLSILSRLSEMTFSFSDRKMGINYGLNRVRFTSPVRSGSKVRARFKLGNYEKLDGGVQVTWNTTVEVEGSEKPALVAEWITRLVYG